MFDYLRGQLVSSQPTRLTLDVGGVGYDLAAPLSTTSALVAGAEVRLWVWLWVREDLLKLYAFGTEEERSLFILLQKVNGIGPTLALALLSRASVADLAAAIADGRTDFLVSLKGVGPKTAQRLITELRDKMAGFGATASVQAGVPASLEGDAIQALEVLGCTGKVASNAVKKAVAAGTDDGLDGVVRRALKIAWPG